MVRINWGSWGILIPIIVISYIIFNTTYWRETKIIESDVVSYYAYLPATFIYNDLSLNFLDESSDYLKTKMWYQPTENGGRVIKTSMGLSFLYFPFFILAHHYCLNSNSYIANGFSLPYCLAIAMSSVFYLILALLFLYKFLKKYFSEFSIFLTLISIAIGTNLLNYVTREPGMSHNYCFFLTSILIYFTDKWITTPKPKYLYFMSGILGLLILIRPTNIVVVFFILLFQVTTWDLFKTRLHQIFKDKKVFFNSCLVFFLIFLPQFIYWKYNSGSWIYFSYNDNERFFFNDPKLLEGLFSYRKGWLLYSPIMALSLLGLLFPAKKIKGVKASILIIVSLHIYIAFSWWAWWYGGGFGARPMIDIYSLLAIPIAICFDFFSDKKILLKLLPISVCFILVFINIFQSWQYREGIINYHGMTKKTYWNVFLKDDYSKDFWESLDVPDYDAAKRGERDL